MSRQQRTLVICVDNASNPVDLELRKIYVSLTSAAEKKHGWVRVIDESGEDYLYPSSMFVPATLPADVRRVVLKLVTGRDTAGAAGSPRAARQSSAGARR